MSSTPFGEHLKREREMRGVSIEEVSAATRISTRFLEAIENDQWERLPGGVFNRGFIRSIARFLGLDEDGLVAEYALETHAIADARVASQAPTEMPRNWRPAAVALGLIVLLLAGAVFGYHHYRARIVARWHRAPARASAADQGGGVPSAPAAPAANNGPSAAPVALELKIEAGKPADVKVVADGKTLFEGTVQADDVKQFEARDTFEISDSDSSALLLELNGQSIPSIGTPGQRGSVTLTRNDLKPAEGASH
ncbi:MAG TPA: helix-turn-helix domain-containing protein [Candidatus Acidoferrales bacterium]|nr:helix-turn-helix domain-containing protein [Candidatus Acidoferrales bacterium]